MAGRIERVEVLRLMDTGAQVVEVLPERQYAYEHLRGAINIPLRQLERDAPRRLDAGRPVVVCCNNSL